MALTNNARLKIADFARDGLPSTRKKTPRTHDLVLIGAPDDRGVKAVGGRIGASRGPAAIEQAFLALGKGIDPALNSCFKNETLRVWANNPIFDGQSIAASHALVRATLTSQLESEAFPVLLGGGHDYGFPHAAALIDAMGAKSTVVINIDAHLDVRPVENGMITSGSPFRLLLEQMKFNGTNFFEIGIQPHCNNFDHLQWLKTKRAHVESLNEVRLARGGLAGRIDAICKLARRKGAGVALSIDIDAFSLVHAPGVSAPQADGFSSQDFFEVMEAAGANPTVRTVGLFEYAPDLDENGKTLRLVSTGLHRLLCGLAKRPLKKTVR